MPELRWTLLIIGVLFLVILAWWERRRPHQASRQAPHISGEPRPISGHDPAWGPEGDSTNSRGLREPTLTTLPEIHTDARGEARSEFRADARSEGRFEGRADVRSRESSRELPIVELPADLPDEIDELDEPIIAERPQSWEPEPPPANPSPASPPATGSHRVAVPAHDPDFDDDELEEVAESAEAEDPDPLSDSDLDSEQPAAGAVLRTAGPVASGSPPGKLPPPPAVPTVPPRVEWPPEEQRKLISLRLVARPPDRLQGRLIRQALSAEGFVLGELEIFHKPDAENRSILSAASLTKPGTFDLETMDTQRYVGLNLFAVLPGPRSPLKAFEDLLMTARMLNERLEGALQDDRGGPLTPTRIQMLRDSLVAEAKS